MSHWFPRWFSLSLGEKSKFYISEVQQFSREKAPNPYRKGSSSFPTIFRGELLDFRGVVIGLV